MASTNATGSVPPPLPAFKTIARSAVNQQRDLTVDGGLGDTQAAEAAKAKTKGEEEAAAASNLSLFTSGSGIGGGSSTLNSTAKLRVMKDVFAMTNHFTNRLYLKGENCTFNLQTTSCFCLGANNAFRRKMFLFVDHRFFERSVLFIIFLNCIALILNTPVIVDRPGVADLVYVAEIVFQVLFTVEAVSKIVALGFVLHRHSYLRSGWNQVDFLIVILGFVSFFIGSNFSAIRLVRVLRPLKAVAKVPELSALVNALMASVPRMRDVLFLLFFVLLIFAILGLQVFVGALHQRCYEYVPEEITTYYNATVVVNASYSYTELIPNVTYGPNLVPRLYPFDESRCTMNPGGGHTCPANTTCEVHLDQFQAKVKNFDNIATSLLFVFKFVSLDNWPGDLHDLQAVMGLWYFIFVFGIVLFGSFFSMNLILAILSSEYEQATEKAGEQADEDGDESPLNGDGAGGDDEDEDEEDYEDENDASGDLQNQQQQEQQQQQRRNSVATGDQEMTTIGDGGKRASVSSSNNGSPKNNSRSGTYTSQSLPGSEQSYQGTASVNQNSQQQHQQRGDTASKSNGSSNNGNANNNSSNPNMHVVSISEEGLHPSKSSGGPTPAGSPNATVITAGSKPSSDRRKSRSKQRRKSTFEPSTGQKIRQALIVFVEHPGFGNFMLGVTVLNVLVLAIDHHDIDKTLEAVLSWINFVCSIVFIIEFIIKLLALHLSYFKDGFNRFDALLVLISIPEMVMAIMSDGAGSGSAFSALRAFRLARVFRVVKSSKKIRLLLVTVFKAAASTSYLFLLLLLFILVTSLTGITLLSKAYPEGDRPNFHNLGEALLTTFIVITGENWMDVTEAGMNGSHWTVIFYFILLFCIGNYIVLNLFVAILIGSFSNMASSVDDEDGNTEVQPIGASEDGKKKEERRHSIQIVKTTDAETETEMTAAEGAGPRRTSTDAYIAAVGSVSTNRDEDKTREGQQGSDREGRERQESTTSLNAFGTRAESTYAVSDLPGAIGDDSTTTPSPTRAAMAAGGGTDSGTTADFDNSPMSNDPKVLLVKKDTEGSADAAGGGDVLLKHYSFVAKRNFSHVLSTLFGKKHASKSSSPSPNSPNGNASPKSAGNNAGSPPAEDGEEGEADDIELVGNALFCFTPENKFRKVCARIASHPYFDLFIVLLIAVSCIMLGFDNPSATKKQHIRTMLLVCDIIFAVAFTIESLIHSIAWGFVAEEHAYLRDPWNRVDFFVVLASYVGFFVPQAQMLRALRSFKLAAKSQSLRVVIAAMFTALPNIANVLLLLLFGFIVFGILGVQLFKGSFVYCTDESILSRTECIGNFTSTEDVVTFLPNTTTRTVVSQSFTKDRQWKHAFFNFNHLGEALLTLFMVAMSDGWSVVMYQAMDSNSYDTAMQKNSRDYMSLFVLGFVVFGSFFMMNLFIGSLIDSFSRERDKKEGRIDESGVSLLTDAQAQWLRTYKVARSSRLSPFVPKPENFFRRACCYIYFRDKERVEADPRFEWTITGAIILNTVIMCFQFYNQPQEMTDFLWGANLFFAILYFVEAVIKLGAMLPIAYFSDSWNRFDFALVPIAFISLFVGGPGTNSIRVLRVARVLRLIKRAEGLARLFNSLLAAIPQLLNVTALLLIVLFIFSVMGTAFFGSVMLREEYSGSALHEYFNFQHAGYSIILLFQIATTEGWWDIMITCMMSPENSPCTEEAGNCGSWVSIPYFVFFMISANAVCINLFIFVIVDNYMEVQQMSDTQTQEVLGVIEQFKSEWSLLDKESTEVLHWRSFVIILRKLPLKFKSGGHGVASKRETTAAFGTDSHTDLRLLKKLRYMDIPVDADGMVRYKDCVNGITKDLYGLDSDSWKDASNLIENDDVEELEDCFKVHHALAVRKIILIFRKRQRDRELARGVKNKLQGLIIKRKSQAGAEETGEGSSGAPSLSSSVATAKPDPGGSLHNVEMVSSQEHEKIATDTDP